MTGTTSQPVRVMLIDDHPMVCRALTIFMMVFDHLQFVGQAETVTAAIQLCDEVFPDVILMDMDMPDRDGAAAARAIRQKYPQVRIIALTSCKDGRRIKRTLEAGVIGYLLKDVSANQLAQAIRAAASGRATISAEAVQALVENPGQPPESGRDLTEREREILALMIDGLNNTQIAGKLIVSPSTIKMHVSNILTKLSFASRTETVTIVLPNRIGPCPSTEFYLSDRRGPSVRILRDEKVSI